MSGDRLWFRSSEVLALTGLTERQLSYYVHTGLVKPDQFGRNYRYTWHNLLELYVIAKLKESGESIQQIREYLPGLHEWLAVFPPEVLSAHILVMRVGGRLVDSFLVQSEAYARAVTPWHRTFVVIRFSALASAVAWADSHKDRGITMEDVAV